MLRVQHSVLREERALSLTGLETRETLVQLGNQEACLLITGVLQLSYNYFTRMCCGSEEGSCVRLIDLCITQL